MTDSRKLVDITPHEFKTAKLSSSKNTGLNGEVLFVLNFAPNYSSFGLQF
jgi:hypothetical protein